MWKAPQADCAQGRHRVCVPLLPLLGERDSTLAGDGAGMLRPYTERQMGAAPCFALDETASGKPHYQAAAIARHRNQRKE